MELPKPYRQFLDELKSVRVARGMSQRHLAQSIKLSRAQYTAIENGRSVVNYAHLHNLAAALGVRFSIGNPKHPLPARLSK